MVILCDIKNKDKTLRTILQKLQKIYFKELNIY